MLTKFLRGINMDKEQVKFKRKISPIGNSIGITLPRELLDYLEASEGIELALSGFKGKHGKFIAIWKDKNDLDKHNTK